MKPHPNKKLVLLIGLASCHLLGCGAGAPGPERASVSGTVTVDGTPLANGSVRFVPIEGTTGPVAGATVENGKYSVAHANGPVVGTNRVEIEGVRLTGKKVPGPMGRLIDENVAAVPAQYNTQSTLVRQVKPGKNVFDFPVTSK